MKSQLCFFGLAVVEEILATFDVVRPDVPAWLDTDVFRVPDDRVFQERRAYGKHNCTYPNDPTTLKDLHKAAHNRATAGEHDDYVLVEVDNHFYRCDRCQPGGGWSGGQSYAWFCGEEDNSRYVNFTRAAYGSSKTGQACWIPGSVLAGPNGAPLEYQQQIGLEHGTIVEPSCYIRDRDFTPTIHPGLNCYYKDDPTPYYTSNEEEYGCSQKQPADSCMLKKGWEQICQCDENCKSKIPSHPDDCCTVTKTIEKLSVYYKWYECTLGDYGQQCGDSNKLV